MFRDFNENHNNNDDDFLNEQRQRLSGHNYENDDKQKDLQRSKSVFLGAIAGVGLACVVGWFALSPKQAKEENVPVIKRPQAAVKIKPSEPGGMQILNQDKSVYQIIEKSGGINLAPEQVSPPPEEPKLLEISQNEEPETITDIIDNIENKEIIVKEIAEPKGIEEAPEAKTISIEEAAKTIETPKKDETKTVATATKERDYILPENRKDNGKDVKTESKKGTAEIDKPATAAAGTWQIQLLSSKNKKAVEDSWISLVKKHSALSGLPHEIEEADLQFDGIFYRLKAGGFSNKVDADKVCNKIKAEGGSCLVKKK